MTVDENYSGPAGAIPRVISANMHVSGTNIRGDPETGRPASASINLQYITFYPFVVSTTLKLRYTAKMGLKEGITFVLQSDLQEYLSSPSTAPGQQSSIETMNFTGTDVGAGLFNVLNWLSLSGKPVVLGQVLRPSDALSFQICVVAGTAGTVEPNFSTNIGATTNDGSVVWACIGSSVPDIQLWEAVAASQLTLGVVIQTKTASSFQLVTTAGITGDTEPTFDDTSGGTTGDGGVTWTSLGAGGAISIPIGDSGRGSYFQTDRGAWTIETILMTCRARLRLKSRAITINADIPFSRAILLSCRKNATIHDRRLSGGFATGKITAYTLEVDGNSGVQKGTVQIQPAIGNGGTTTTVLGTPTYVDEGYVDPGAYQVYTGSSISIVGGTADLTYTPPSTAVGGINFPLSKSDVVIRERIVGSIDTQAAAIMQVVAAEDAAQFPRLGGTFGTPQSIAQQQEQARLMQEAAQKALEEASMYYELILKPVDGQNALEQLYGITTSLLVIEKQIDLSAASTP